jgi:Uncharacterised nucleotidyltransferase
MLNGSISDWLIYCADPLGSRVSAPRQTLSVSQARELVERAEYHGVLAALTKNLPQFTDGEELQKFTEVKHNARERHRLQRAFAVMLQTQADAVMTESSSIPATIVKGPVFAQTIYPQPWYRPFTDIDILVAPEGLAPLETVLHRRGFRFAGVDDSGLQRVWVNPELQPTTFEIHLDLMHSNRWNCSFRYGDIAEAPQAPAAILMTAIVHGGAGHRFLRMQHVIDVGQAARSLGHAKDEISFEALVKKTNARTLAAACLLFVGRIMAEPRCLDLAVGLGEDRVARLAARCLGRLASTGARKRYDPIAIVQRTIFRGAIGLSDRRRPLRSPR